MTELRHGTWWDRRRNVPLTDRQAALLLGDPTSYLHARPRFTPNPAFTHNDAFGLAELINVALGRSREA
jgi:hypothetical protein